MTKNEIKKYTNEAIRFATLPNFLTLSRLFLLPLILLFLITDEVYSALILMLASWLSDALDGFFARRLNQVTAIGKILDHLVDKIWVGSVLVVLVMTKRLPVSITLGVILRDLLIVIAGSFLIKRGIIPYSNIIGKLTGFFFALLILTYTLSIKILTQPILYITWVFLVISFLSYIPFFIKNSRTSEISRGVSD